MYNTMKIIRLIPLLQSLEKLVINIIGYARITREQAAAYPSKGNVASLLQREFLH